MPSLSRHLMVLVLLASAAAGLTACSGEPEQDAEPAAVAEGGEARVQMTSYPDFLDPALTYTQEGYQTLWTVYTPLLTYRRAEGAAGAELVPGLAEAMPEVSEDGRTYTLTLRDGLEYSDGTPVRASDFEQAIRRVLHMNSGGARFYLPIVGASAYMERDRENADISGIVADDDTRAIRIELRRPDGAFPYVLAMSFAAPVPGDTSFENLSQEPPPGVGPFKLEEVRQNRGYELVRNDRFAGLEDVPQPRLDRITVEINDNQRQQVQEVMRNEVDYIVDPPPADLLPQVRAEHPDRYEEFVTNSTYYFFLNHREAPFDDRRVRQAVNYAVDRRALTRLFGGLLEPSCNFLPPGMRGHQRIDPCPYGDVEAPPQMERARELVRAAGAEGERVEVYGYSEGPARPSTEYLADVLNQIGLRAEPQILEGAVYWQTVGSQQTRAQAGYANWHQDFPHPRNFLSVVDPASIRDRNNPNLGNIEDPQLAQSLDEVNRQPIEAAEDLYAQIDRRLAEEAHQVSFGHRRLTNFVSERVDVENCTVTHPVYQLDLAQLCFTR